MWSCRVPLGWAEAWLLSFSPREYKWVMISSTTVLYNLGISCRTEWSFVRLAFLETPLCRWGFGFFHEDPGKNECPECTKDPVPVVTSSGSSESTPLRKNGSCRARTKSISMSVRRHTTPPLAPCATWFVINLERAYILSTYYVLSVSLNNVSLGILFLPGRAIGAWFYPHKSPYPLFHKLLFFFC